MTQSARPLLSRFFRFQRLIAGLFLLPLLGVYLGTTHAQTPTEVNFQGRIVINGISYNGTGQFQFALVSGDGLTTYWSNDGTSTGGSEPTANISLTLTNGLYSILLGDTSISGMTQSVGASIFTNSDVRLRVWFNDGTHGWEKLTPDARLASVGYAFSAQNAVTYSGVVNASQLPASVLTNGASGVTLNGATLAGATLTGANATGTFTGDATGLTNLLMTGLNSGGALGYVTNYDDFLLSQLVQVDQDPGSIATADFNNDGYADLAVADYQANNVDILTNNGAGRFLLSGRYSTGNAPSFVTAADMNNDGRPDLIVVNQNDLTVVVLTNNGDGTFTPASTNTTGLDPFAATVGDVNGDHRPDILVANYSFADGTITVLLNNGDGTFREDAGSPYLASFPGDTNAIGPSVAWPVDVNGDGLPDIVTVNEYEDNLTILTNNGDGTFTYDTQVPVGQEPFWVVPADVNGDRFVDFVAANGFDNTISVVTNDGVGNFTTSATVSVGVSPTSLLATNFYGGSTVQLAVANAGTGNNGSVTLLTNAGAGIFAVQGTLANRTADFIASADYNHDGRLDLAITSYGANRVQIWTNSTTTFTTTLQFSGSGAGLTNLPATSLVGTIPDQNLSTDVALQDQANDFVSANNVFAGTFQGMLEGSGYGSFYGSFYGDGAGLTNLNINSTLAAVGFSIGTNWSALFNLAQLPSTGNYPEGIAAADFNNDGQIDLAVANSGDNDVTVYFNNANGSGNFTAATPFSTGAGPSGIAVGDFNQDGKPDLVVTCGTANDAEIYTNTGTGNFVFATSVPTGNQPYPVVVADFNQDGKPDFAVINLVDYTIDVYTNDGAGGFELASMPNGGNGPTAFATADFNNDGKPDLVVADATDNTVTVLTNDGTGNFAAAANVPADSLPESVTAADFNHDGKPDFAVANFYGNDVLVYTNDGAGGFELASTNYGDTYPAIVIAPDVNNDGKPDLISISGYNGTASIMLGHGDGTFGSADIFPVQGYEPQSVVAADFNGDGGQDFVTANSSGSLSVFTNSPVIAPRGVGGNGGGLTNLNASQITTGTLSVAQLPTAAVTNNASNVSLSGSLTGTFTGDGSGLTNTVTSGNYLSMWVNGTAPVLVPHSFQSVSFSWTNQMSGWTPTTLNRGFLCPARGLYLVQYHVQAAYVSPYSDPLPNITLKLVLNGTEINGSEMSAYFQVSDAVNEVANLSQSIIVNANAGDVLQLEFTGSSTSIELFGLGDATTNPYATLTVVRIQ